MNSNFVVGLRYIKLICVLLIDFYVLPLCLGLSDELNPQQFIDSQQECA